MNDLEQQLARQELRRVPSEWRGEILNASEGARTAMSARTNDALVEPLHTQREHADSAVRASSASAWLRVLVWPSPRAWAALAGAWVLVALIQLTMPSVGSTNLAPATAMSAGAVEAWREQQRLLAELFPQERRTEPAKAVPPRRRSEREHDLYFA